MSQPPSPGHRTSTARSRDDRNNFDALRLILALLVFWAHRSFIWYPDEENAPLPGIATGFFAVMCFFVISGYLIFQSYERSPKLAKYVEKRARRIVPAYIAVITICSVGGVFLTTLPIGEYFGWRWFRYLISNLAFLHFVQPTLPGVFRGMADNGTVDGALWSIRVEVMFYAAVPVVCLYATRLGRKAVFISLYLMSAIWFLLFTYLESRLGASGPDFAKELPGALAFFISGAAIFYYWDFYVRHSHTLLLMSAAILTIHWFIPLFAEIDILLPIALAVLVLYVALLMPFRVNAGKYGDLSYGLYIIHSPVLQTIKSLGVFADNHWLAMGTALGISLILAFLSWHLIEKPWLSPASHYVQANSIR